MAFSFIYQETLTNFYPAFFYHLTIHIKDNMFLDYLKSNYYNQFAEVDLSFAVSLYTSPDDSYAMITVHELSDEISILIDNMQLNRLGLSCD